MDRYPLQVSIPSVEVTRNVLRVRHTAYCIQLDDCGRLYARLRRYKNFLWLHGELQRRDLSCTLPVLPAKKVIRNLEPAFVERRRQGLENYLRALIRLPQVIQDDSLWSFLDADLATAFVPKFLCRPSDAAGTEKCLVQLERVVAKESNLFRLCNDAVLQSLIAFAEGEAHEVVSTVSPQGQTEKALYVKLNCRLRYCTVLQSLIAHESARNGLMDGGIFSALISLLCKVSDDSKASCANDSASDEAHRSVTVSVVGCLQKLLEATHGVAMFHFCQQDDGFAALKRLAAPDAVSLHEVAASLVWRGLQNEEVVSVFAGNGARGFPLLGRLLQSEDLQARVLAGLCIACTVRHEGALDDLQREEALLALEALPTDLDASEAEAIKRTAAMADGSADNLPSIRVDRDNALVSLLQSVCSVKALPRLRYLLGDASVVDAVTLFVVVLLDHFVVHAQHDLDDLSVMVPQLQRLLDVADCTDEGILRETQSRAGHVLIRLDLSKAETGEAPTLAAFRGRSKLLEVLSHESECRQVEANQRAELARGHHQRQCDHVDHGALTQKPCVDERRCAEFGSFLKHLGETRVTLESKMGISQRAVECLHAGLEQRGFKHSILNSDLERLVQRIADQTNQESRSMQALAEAESCEARARDVANQVKERIASRKEAEQLAREREDLVRKAERRSQECANREAELGDIRRNAPAQLARCTAQLSECERKQQNIEARGQQLAVESRENESRAVALQEASRESEAALHRIATLRAELVEFRDSLNSELILGEGEVEQLRQFESQLQHARPSRLKHGALVGAEGGEQTKAPVWDDTGAEQEYLNTPHFRSFMKLFGVREQLWEQEARWTKEQLSLVVSATNQLMRRQEAHAHEQRSVMEESAHLRHDIQVLDDDEGHAHRLDEARTAAAEANEMVRICGIDSAEVVAQLQMETVNLERIRSEQREADSELEKAKKVANVETEMLLRVRKELDSQMSELEAKVRGDLHAWTTVELEQQRLSLLLLAVSSYLQEEAQCRKELRSQVQLLIAELSDLDQQLDVQELS